MRKIIDKVKKKFTVDYAKDQFETVHNFALETTERFFSKERLKNLVGYDP